MEALYKKSTAIGSMPHTDSQSAINLISKYLPHIPHWPQLPRKSSKEGFVHQYLNPMLEAGLIAQEKGKVYFCDHLQDWDDRLVEYYEKVLQVQEKANQYDAFAFPIEAAEGFYEFLRNPPVAGETIMVKGQVSGPVSLGLGITDSKGNPSFYSEQLRDITVKTLALNACWQVKKLEQLDFPVLIFADDPGIYSFGTSGYVGLRKDAIQESLREIGDSVKKVKGYAGIHACAGVDWSIPLGIELDVIDFDAYEYFTSMMVYPEMLNVFLQKGGVLAWGLVPTSPAVEEESAASLMESLEEKIESLATRGVDQDKLKQQLLLTPSCGTGTLTEEQTEKVYRLTMEMEKEINRMF